MLLIKAPGALVLLENVEETAGISCGLKAAENLLHHGGAVPLSPAARAGIEGDQLPPGGQIGGAELADGIPGVQVHPGRAVGGAAEGKAFLIEQESVVDALLVVLSEGRDPAVVGDLPCHIAGGDAVPIGGPPAQSVEAGHILKMLFCLGVGQVQFYHPAKKDCILAGKEI